MNRAKLNLLAYPALLASMLLVANPTHAAEVVAQPTETVESTPATPMFEVVFEQKLLNLQCWNPLTKGQMLP